MRTPDNSLNITDQYFLPHLLLHIFLKQPVYIARAKVHTNELVGIIVNYEMAQKTYYHLSGLITTVGIVTCWHFVLKTDLMEYNKSTSDKASLIISIPFNSIDIEKIIAKDFKPKR